MTRESHTLPRISLHPICRFLIFFFWLAGPSALFFNAASAVELGAKPTSSGFFFKPTPQTPEFFEDELDLRVQDTIIHAIENNPAPLKEHLAYIREKDQEAERSNSPRSGLALPLIELMMSLAQEEEKIAELKKEALKEAATKSEKELVIANAPRGELDQASRWLWMSSVNRWGKVFNHFTRLLNPVTLVSGSFVGPVVDSTLGLFWGGVRTTEITAEERRALTLYLDAVSRDPDIASDEEIKGRIEKLLEKKKEALLDTSLQQAEDSLSKGDLAMARFYFERALELDGDSPRAVKGLERVEKDLKDREKARASALSVMAAVLEPAGEKDETSIYEEILADLARRDSHRLNEQSENFLANYPSSSIRPQVEEIKTVTLEMKGKHEEAIELLKELAKKNEDQRQSRKSLALATSAEYNKLVPLARAETTRRTETLKFVLGGQDFVRSNLAFGVSPFLAQGAAAATSLGAITLIRTAGNLVSVFVGNPISRRPVIHEGERFLRENPDSADATRIHRTLAAEYEKEGMHDRALHHERLSGPANDARLKDLREKASNGLLAAVDAEADRERRETLLVLLLKTYPGTQAAKEASRKLRRMFLEGNQGMRLSKKFLMEHRELVGPDGLALNDSLIDGSGSNGELSEDGIVVHNETELTLKLEGAGGDDERRISLPSRTLEKVFGMLREIQYRRAVEAYSEKGDVVSAPLMTAGLGELGTNSDFLRDQEFLSETEEKKNGPLLPQGPFGTSLSFATDGNGPRGSLGLPIPVLRDWVPVDFLFRADPYGFSLLPQVGTFQK